MRKRNPLIDDLARVLDEHRARESEAEHEEHMQDLEAERLASSMREQAVFDALTVAAREFMKLEERRVAAFERLAEAASRLANRIDSANPIYLRVEK